MLRSLFSGVSGLRGHQLMMDVVGNNISNVNTTGYKGSNAVFQDLLSQVLSGAGAPQDQLGGTNPGMVGLGSRVAAIQTSFNQGALQVTGRSTDLAIQGDGFFIVNNGGQQMYSRAGNFEFDGSGTLVTVEGGRIQGWMANPNTGRIDSTGPVGNITMAPGQIIAPVQTDEVRIGKMLSANAATGTTFRTAMEVFDSQGVAQNVQFAFTKTADNAWSVDAFDETATNIGTVALTFDPANGQMNSQTPDPWTITPTTPAANWPTPITINFGNPLTDADALREFGGPSTAQTLGKTGSPAGTLQSFKISDDGVVTGVFSNGQNLAIGQIALANFNNPGGLEKAGGSMFRTTANSGVPQIGAGGTGGRGGLAAGSLEMSNVDLSQEFTNLIIAQRGFQANSKVITSSDELLQDLLSLKR